MNAILSDLLRPVAVATIGLLAATSTVAETGDNADYHQIPAIKSPLAHKVLLVSSEFAGERVVSGGSFGAVVYSDDQGATWRQANVPTQNLITTMDFVSDREGWAGSHDTLILHTTDGGENWEIQHEDLVVDGDIAKPVLDIYFRDPEHGIAIGAYSLLMTTDDGGATWEYEDTSELYDLLLEHDMEPEPGFHAISPMGDGYLIVGELGTVLFWDPDGVEAAPISGDDTDADVAEALPEAEASEGEPPVRTGPWRILPSPYAGSFFGANAALSSGEVLIYGLRGRIYRSSDEGMTWQRIETPEVTANIFDSVELSDGSVIAVGGTGTLLRIRPGSKIAERIPYGNFNSFVSVERLSDTELLLFGSAGVQRFELAEQ